MALVLPRVRPAKSDLISDAELDVLAELEKLPDDWIVLHSLWLKSHAVKLHAEADFVIIGDKAVTIVETKGGEVWRDDENNWHFRTKSGSRESVKREGPLDQARGAYYAIRQHFDDQGRGDLFANYVWGYCAILPECVLKIDPRDTAIDPALLLDKKGYPATLFDYLETLASYWRSRSGGATHHVHRKADQMHPTIGLPVRREIVAWLRPQMERVVGVGTEVASSEQQLVRLTERQIAALDYASAEPRNILCGSAGTGKTVLAVEQARRMCTLGKRVLFVCFNSLLAARVALDLQRKGCKAVVALNYHQLASDLTRKFNNPLSFSEQWPEFERSLKDALVKLVAEIGPQDRFDYLVVDEAQDMMSPDFMELLDCLLEGGLKYGNWLLAIDTQQKIFRTNFNDSEWDRIGRMGRRTALELNCRNTRPIAAYVRAMSGIGVVSTRAADGEMPAIRYYGDRPGYVRLLKKVLNELIAAFCDAGLSASDIVVLTGDMSFLPKEVLEPGFCLRALKRVQAADADANYVRYATVQQFKGLEAKAIVLIGIEHFDSDFSRDLFYVGASRAKGALRILLPESCDQIHRASPEIARLLRAPAQLSAVVGG